MILVVGGVKGGSGRTTIALNLFAKLLKENKKSLLVDCGICGFASMWAENYTKRTGKQAPYVSWQGNITKQLSEESSKYDFIIVDCAGVDTVEFRSSLVVANKAIFPLKLSSIDLDTLPTINDISYQVKTFNPDLKAFSILNMVVKSTSPNRISEYLTEMEKHPHLIPCKTVIQQHQNFINGLNEGKSIYDLDNEKIKQDFDSLIKEII